jgi:pimeloyl-ACP methyl ester carboxylesterase
LQEDLYNYDVYDKIENIQAPVFLLTGDHDRSTPLYQVKHLFDELKGRKELIVLRDCPHSMYEKNNLDALERALEDVISFL